MKKILVLLSLVGLLLITVGASAEDDHGDSPLTATPIPTDGSLVQGCIEKPGDVDYEEETFIESLCHSIVLESEA
jgi:hypothetical protein